MRQEWTEKNGEDLLVGPKRGMALSIRKGRVTAEEGLKNRLAKEKDISKIFGHEGVAG